MDESFVTIRKSRVAEGQAMRRRHRADVAIVCANGTTVASFRPGHHTGEPVATWAATWASPAGSRPSCSRAPYIFVPRVTIGSITSATSSPARGRSGRLGQTRSRPLGAGQRGARGSVSAEALVIRRPRTLRKLANHCLKRVYAAEKTGKSVAFGEAIKLTQHWSCRTSMRTRKLGKLCAPES